MNEKGYNIGLWTNEDITSSYNFLFRILSKVYELQDWYCNKTM